MVFYELPYRPSAEAQHVAQQLAGIRIGHFQRVRATALKRALLIGVLG